MQIESIDVPFTFDIEVFRADFVRPQIDGDRLVLMQSVSDPRGIGQGKFDRSFILSELIYANDTFAAVFTVMVTKRQIRTIWSFYREDSLGDLFYVTWSALSPNEQRIVANSWLECSKVRPMSKPHKEIERFLS